MSWKLPVYGEHADRGQTHSSCGSVYSGGAEGGGRRKRPLLGRTRVSVGLSTSPKKYFLVPPQCKGT